VYLRTINDLGKSKDYNLFADFHDILNKQKKITGKSYEILAHEIYGSVIHQGEILYRLSVIIHLEFTKTHAEFIDAAGKNITLLLSIMRQWHTFEFVWFERHF
jgi:hypothetical protein